MRATRTVHLLFPLLLVTGVSCERGSELQPIGPVTAIASPAGPASGQPFLSAADDGSVLLSWLEKQEAGHALRYARLQGEAWSVPNTIMESASFFVNWADFPSLIQLSDGRLAAHWLARSGTATFAYDVMLAVSEPGGSGWSEPIRPHRDGTETEHGFASLFEHDGGLAAVWLDGRNFAGAGAPSGDDPDGGDGGHGEPTREMTVRYTTFVAGGLGAELLIDDRSCDCCQTDVALTADGPVVVYRDRSGTEIRDIVASRFAGDRWSEPSAVHDDLWEIAGCPVNGPAIAAAERDVVVAWYTAAQDTARVLVAFSSDAAASFAPPVRVDAGDPVGRVDALMLDDGTAIVTWLERVPDGARVLARRVGPRGRISSTVEIGGTSAGRPSGFPRMARSHDRLVFAWTVPGEPAVIEMASAPLPGR